MSLRQLSDAELLMRWRAGQTAAGSLLVQRHNPRLRRLFSIAGPSADWVADMVQQTFLIFCERHHEIREPEKVRAYLLGIANNLLRTYFKAKRRRDGGEVDIDDTRLVDVEAPGISTLFGKQQERVVLMKAMRCISIQEQLILQYKFWDELTNREIAEVMDVPVGTIAGRLATAKQRLARALRQHETVTSVAAAVSNQRGGPAELGPAATTSIQMQQPSRCPSPS